MTDPSFWALLDRVQPYVVQRGGALLGSLSPDGADSGEVLPADRDASLREGFLTDLIRTYFRDRGIPEDPELIDRLLDELTGDSVLSPYLKDDRVEEINVNRWDDITVTLTSGEKFKSERTFRSAAHATDILRRMLRRSGRVLDNTVPVAQGHLPGNARVTVLKTPVVDDRTGVAASIRKLRPGVLGREALVSSGMLTADMMDFLCDAARYGVSAVVAGRTSSGKTTLLNVLAGAMPDDCRIYTIESGARELDLVREDPDGKALNNVVHTRSRPSDRAQGDITQETLVTLALRFDPDLIVVGEIRDAEAHGAVEASLTGHTVLSTVHSGPGAAAHGRIALLCQRRFALGMDVSLLQCRRAFPLVVFAHPGAHGRRRVMDVTACLTDDEGHADYRVLCRFAPAANSFRAVNPPSRSLFDRMQMWGAPKEVLNRWWTKGDL